MAGRCHGEKVMFLIEATLAHPTSCRRGISLAEDAGFWWNLICEEVDPNGDEAAKKFEHVDSGS
jgi:hypothetical protein